MAANGVEWCRMSVGINLPPSWRQPPNRRLLLRQGWVFLHIWSDLKHAITRTSGLRSRIRARSDLTGFCLDHHLCMINRFRLTATLVLCIEGNSSINSNLESCWKWNTALVQIIFPHEENGISSTPKWKPTQDFNVETVVIEQLFTEVKVNISTIHRHWGE